MNENPPSPDFADRIYRIKRELGLKKHEIASALGCSRTMLFHYEKGDPPAPADVMGQVRRLERMFSGGSVPAERDVYVTEAAEISALKRALLAAEKKLEAISSILWEELAERAAPRPAEPDEPAEIVDLNPALPRHVKIIRKRTNDNTEKKDSSA